MIIGKERKMKTTKTTQKTTMTATVRMSGRTRPIAGITADDLTARMRNGRRRIECLGWKRLATIYYANEPGSEIRKVIDTEARRCGYTLATILALNAQ